MNSLAFWPVLYGAGESSGFISIVVALLAGGGLGAIATFLRAGREADAIAADTLIKVNRELREELERRDKVALEREKALQAEVNALRERIAVLENQAS